MQSSTESSHALVHPMREAKALGPDHVMVINLSGRGDKDLGSISEYLEAHPEAAS